MTPSKTDLIYQILSPILIIYIDGADELRLDRYKTYTLMNEATQAPIVLGQDEIIEFVTENVDKEEKVALTTLTIARDKENNVIA